MSVRILTGDAGAVLRTLPDASVHCVVSSPPYYGLRDYQTARWEGGDPGCDHRLVQQPPTGLGGPADRRDYETKPYRSVCAACGAVRVDAQLGLEATPEAYIARLVAVFREVRRVLRADGTAFVNIADSYAGSWGNQGRKATRGQQRPINGEMLQPALDGRYPDFASNTGLVPPGYKPKDLHLIPEQLALALRADGWWVRSRMPWLKRSCLPESVTDRPTTAVEYVYLLTKSPRYFWDEAAVRRVGVVSAGTLAAKASAERSALDDVASRPPEYWEYTGERSFRNSDLFFDSLGEPHGLISDAGGAPLALDVNPAPFPGAHFATFPPRLIAPLIRAGTSERGCCAACGAPWVRQVAARYENPQNSTTNGPRSLERRHETAGFPVRLERRVQTIGWASACTCDAPVVPCTVLDPFIGSGTTAVVCDQLGRDCIGIDLSPGYARMAEQRVTRAGAQQDFFLPARGVVETDG